MIHDFSDLGFLPDSVRLRLYRAARITVGELDALATVQARRCVDGAWSDWTTVAGLLSGEGYVWGGAGGCVVELACANHTALVIEDGLRAVDLPRKATVQAALEWLGLDPIGTRAELNARLEAAP